MKKTLIALMALAGVACGAVESGSYTLSMNQWTTGDDTLYNYLNGTLNEGGTLVFDLDINYTGEDCGAYQTLLHVGQKETGFSIMANGSSKLIVGELHITDNSDANNHELDEGNLVTGTNDVIITLNGSTTGTATVDISINGAVYSGLVSPLVWSSMNWNTTNGEHAKYSVNVGAPGWDSYLPAQSTTLTAATATFTAIPTPSVPEPTTATLSLLALAGLAARRRRK